jgi:hypothetical protein
MVSFRTKNQNFGGSCNGICWYILWPFVQLSGHLAYFMAMWHMFPRFGTFYPFWYVVPRKNWQPCIELLDRAVSHPDQIVFVMDLQLHAIAVAN